MSVPENDRSAELHTQIQHALMEELIATVEKHKAVVNNLEEIAFQTDTTGSLTFVNDSWLRLFGSSPESVHGHPLTEYMDSEEDRTWLQSKLHSGTGASTSLPGHSAAGQEALRLNRNISMCGSDGRPYPTALAMCRVKDGWVGSIRDLRRELQTEARSRQAAKMEVVGRIAGRVAHDFNNLLTVIGGNLELLQLTSSQDEDNDQTEILEDVFSAIDNGSVLVGHLQCFTLDQAYQPTVLDTASVLAIFTRSLSRSFGESMTVDQECAENLLVRADERAFKGALMNISINARDAMTSGGQLSIRAHSQRIEEADVSQFGRVPAGDYVAITIQDTGCGIPAKLLSRITEPFISGNTPESASGLGLSMVSLFLEQSGGGLHIDSRVGQGTSVTLFLPRASEEDPPTIQTGDTVPADKALGRVLLIEDTDSVRNYAQRCLSRMGYEVVSAPDGATGLEHLKHSGPFDLVFSDVVMPGGISGHDVAAKVEEFCGPATAILLTSGYITEANRDLSNRWNYLRKPYTASQLGERIQKMFIERDART